MTLDAFRMLKVQGKWTETILENLLELYKEQKFIDLTCDFQN